MSGYVRAYVIKAAHIEHLTFAHPGHPTTGTAIAVLPIFLPERRNGMSKPTKSPPEAKPLGPVEKRPGVLGAENIRGEVAGCPTGMAAPGQEQAVQRPGGGGAPATGGGTPIPPASPEEGVTPEQAKRSGLDEGG